MILEATYNNDSIFRKKADLYIRKIQSFLNSYPNGKTYYDTNILSVRVEVNEDLEVVFLDLDSLFNKNTTSGDFTPLINGRFVIYIYNCYIELKDKNIYISYKKDTLFHELIHYMDFKRSKDSSNINTKTTNNRNEYLNNSLELNAFFQQYFKKFNNRGKTFKEYILNFLKTEMERGNFKSSYKKEVWNYLNEKNKKKIIKRLYNSYIKNDLQNISN